MLSALFGAGAGENLSLAPLINFGGVQGGKVLPSQERVHTLIKTGDVFRYAIVGFSAIEAALDCLIVETLVTTHKLELRRLSAELKVDLAIGLGVLDKESKGLICRLSKIRNHYAHSLDSEGEYCSIDELKSCFSKRHRELSGEYFAGIETFMEAMRVSFVAVYYELLAAIEHRKESKIARVEAAIGAEAAIAISNFIDSPRQKQYMEDHKGEADMKTLVRDSFSLELDRLKSEIRNRLQKEAQSKRT